MTMDIYSFVHELQVTTTKERNISSRFFINSEAFASELIANFEDVFRWLHIYIT